MDKFGIKATLYDLIGYVFPGFLLITACYSLFFCASLPTIAEASKITFSIPFACIALATFYVTGHAIAALSSLVFENPWVSGLVNKVYAFDTSIYDERSLELFGVDYSTSGGRIAITYCLEKFPATYGLAFIFLSIYGFSRNICVVTIILTVSYLYKTNNYNLWSLVSAGSILLMLHNYFRFKQYFNNQIASSIMIK